MLVLTLNTATHNPNEDRKIGVEDWVDYCAELQEAEPRCSEAFLRAVWQSIYDQEIRMPMEGIFPDMVRRGYLDVHEQGAFTRVWKNRWFILSHNWYGLRPFAALRTLLTRRRRLACTSLRRQRAKTRARLCR